MTDNRPTRPPEGRPREATQAADTSYSEAPSRKTSRLPLVIAGIILVAVIAGVLVLPTILPGTSTPPSSQPTVIPPAVDPTSPSTPDPEPTTDAVPESVVDVPGYAHVLEYGLEDGDQLSQVFDGYALTISATETSSSDGSASFFTLAVEAVDTSTGEYVRDLALSLVPQDPTSLTVVPPGDPGAWRITAYRGDSGNAPAVAAVITIDGDTRVAVGLGFGWVTEWSAS